MGWLQGLTRLWRAPDRAHPALADEESTEARAGALEGAARSLRRSSGPGTVQSQSDPLLTLDDGGRVLRLNRPAQRLLGQSAVEVIGKPLADLLTSPEDVHTLLARLREAGTLNAREVLLQPEKGQELPVLLTGFVLRGGGRRVESVLLLTPRKRGEEVAAAAPEGSPPADDGALRVELERLQAECRRGREEADQLRAERERLHAELQQARDAAEAAQRRAEEKAGQRKSDPGAEARPAARPSEPSRTQNQLWSWAEEELRRLQATVQRTRERLRRTEDELARAQGDRKWIEDRHRRAEEEIQQLRDELQSAHREVSSIRQERLQSERSRQRVEQGRRLAAQQRLMMRRRGEEAPPNTTSELARQPMSGNGSESLADSLPSSSSNDDGSADLAEALARVDGDVEFLRVIASAFSTDCPGLIEQLREAVLNGDRRQIEIRCRSLRGAVANFGARAAVQSAVRLEALAESGDLGEVGDAFESLCDEIERLRPAIDSLRREGLVLPG